jgi:UDPglucose 6-dehydrogenase
MKITVVGTGYVGLVTGTCFAEKGNDVICVDIDTDKIAKLKAGKIPIYEPELEEMVQGNLKRGTLQFTTQLEEGVKGAMVIFLALPTPEAEDGSADLTYVLDVANKLSTLLTGYTVIVNKSTVPPGTAPKVKKQISDRTHVKFDVVSNPEFLKEGDAMHDFQHPDRIVIGVESEDAWSVMRELYLPFVPNREDKLKRVTVATAELTKYAANTALAAKITLMNELSALAESIGADIREVAEGIGSDARIGDKFLNVGPGYGGSCFPKDVQALIHTAHHHGHEFIMTKAVHEANNRQKKRLFEKIDEFYEHKLKGKLVAVWGLSFKPNTDDIRETPAFTVIDALIQNGARVVAYDPKAIDKFKMHHGEKNSLLSFAKDRYSVLENADALIIITDWDEFKAPDWQHIKKSMKKPILFDGRSLYDPQQMKERGFYYSSLGRRAVDGR